MVRGGHEARRFFREGGVAPGERTLRERWDEIAQRAAKAGIPEAAGFDHMTPREIERILIAHAARRRQRLEALDLAAWLTGRYAALAWHAPERYPRRPDGVRRPPEAMSEEAMKSALMTLAEREEE